LGWPVESTRACCWRRPPRCALHPSVPPRCHTAVKSQSHPPSTSSFTGLWRSRGASSDRGLPRECQPYWPSGLLRRRETDCRDDDDGLPPPSRCRGASAVCSPPYRAGANIPAVCTDCSRGFVSEGPTAISQR
jgi:hypothetical protein